MAQGSKTSRANGQESYCLDEPSVWPGVIQKGSHVRYTGASTKNCDITVGDIGIVQHRNSAGIYYVDFPEHTKFMCRPLDLVVDATADRVRPGALVTLKSSVTTPKYGWEKFKVGMRGLVHKVESDGVVYVQFGLSPEKGATENLWKFQLKELEIASNYKGTWPGELQLGQAVRVPLSSARPSAGCGSPQSGEVGYVRSFRPLPGGRSHLYTCDFPSAKGWQGRSSDLEIDEVASFVRPGKRVRVRRGIAPKHGWSDRPRFESIGTVLSISHDGGCVLVCFPENPRWKGALTEVETLDHPQKKHSHDKQQGKSCHGVSDQKESPEKHGSPNDEKLIGSGKKIAVGKKVVIWGMESKDGISYNGKMANVTSVTANHYKIKFIGKDTGTLNVKGRFLLELPSRKFEDGEVVIIKDLTSDDGATWNGLMAKVVKYTESSGIYVVQIKGMEKTKKIRESNLAKTVSYKHAIGSTVAIKGLSSKEGTPLNGKLAKVISFDGRNRLYSIQLISDGKSAKVKEDCLEVPTQQVSHGMLGDSCLPVLSRLVCA